LAPVHVAVNALHAKTGGGLTYLRNMLPLLAGEPGLTLHLFASGETLGRLASEDPRIRVHCVTPWHGRAALVLWEQMRFPAILRGAGIDVTFSPANFGPLLAPRPVILLRNALGMIGRDRRLAIRVYWAFLAVATWLSLAFCRRAIAVSEYARRAIVPGPLAILRRRVTIIPHGVAEMFRSGAGGARASAEPYVLAVADLYPQKNLLKLIEAFAMLHSTRPRLALRIAGRRVDVAYARELEVAVERYGLGGAVAFLGEVAPETLAGLYRGCAVFAFPSTVETFGNPLVEAMAAGAPIACSKAAAMPEILADAGLYFDPEDALTIADRIATLLDDPALSCALAQRGAERARRFSWAETARRTAAVLRDSA
jgi:glycosyltransferase involved in cell wall biosynthesis